jgi:hypothetical protein
MRWRRRPEPPEDVRIVRRDGTQIGAEVIYTGRKHGIHEWHIVGVTLHPGDAVHIERLPPHTSVGGDYEP